MRRARNGFTLLELVLVMVIICTVLAMAAPSLRGFFASRQTMDAAAQLVALTRYARAQAAAEGRTWRLNLDTKESKYWLTAQTPRGFETVASDYGRSFNLPQGITAQWRQPADVVESGWITLYPDGRSQQAEILLTGRQGERVSVVCASAVSQFQVVALQNGESM